MRILRKEVINMGKRTITKWWIWGLVFMIAGGIVAAVGSIVMVAHIVNATAGHRYFVPDNFYWTTIVIMMLGGIVAGCGWFAQLVTWIGAVFNTHRLADMTWFHVLLWCGLVGHLVVFATLGIQMALVFGRSEYVAIVWLGYVVGGLIEWIVMVCYLIAGPDGMAGELPQIATTAPPPKTLAPTG
jgi:hypothetical protein